MTVIISIPHDMERKLQHKAQMERVPLEQLIIDLLRDALETETAFPSPEEVVARIQAAPVNPASLRLSSGSLAEALRRAPEDPDFDLSAWNQSWAVVEAEMQTITRANAAAEGRA